MFGIRTYITVAIISIIGVSGFFGYRYITQLQLKNAQLEVLTVTQKNALESANNAISRLKEDMAFQRQLMEELNTRLSESEEYINNLRETLSEHDLEYLALMKPGLIERIINNATDEVFDDLERITNSK